VLLNQNAILRVVMQNLPNFHGQVTQKKLINADLLLKN